MQLHSNELENNFTDLQISQLANWLDLSCTEYGHLKRKWLSNRMKWKDVLFCIAKQSNNKKLSWRLWYNERAPNKMANKLISLNEVTIGTLFDRYWKLEFLFSLLVNSMLADYAGRRLEHCDCTYGMQKTFHFAISNPLAFHMETRSEIESLLWCINVAT